MTRDEVVAALQEAQQHVRVGCDEYHAHTARQGCIVAKSEGEKPYVTICELAETLLELDAEVQSFAGKVGLR